MDITQPDEFWHFAHAQARVYDQVLHELTAGRKSSHWMWFVFPQLRGLGRSWLSARYAIDSLAEAHRYLDHYLLGPRLTECTRLVLNVQGKPADDIFGGVDTLKFHSCVTLFSLCDHPDTVFADAIDKYFAGKPDHNTLRLLGAASAPSQRRATSEWERP